MMYDSWINVWQQHGSTDRDQSDKIRRIVRNYRNDHFYAYICILYRPGDLAIGTPLCTYHKES